MVQSNIVENRICRHPVTEVFRTGAGKGFTTIDFELLRSFVSVVDAGGFTRAGERVHRTQSTVSQQIKRLEGSIGRPLLLRKRKRASPTEDGERLLSYARRILALADEAHHPHTTELPKWQPENSRAIRTDDPQEIALRTRGRMKRSKFFKPYRGFADSPAEMKNHSTIKT